MSAARIASALTLSTGTSTIASGMRCAEYLLSRPAMMQWYITSKNKFLKYLGDCEIIPK